MVLMVNKNIAPKKKLKLPVAKPYPAVHKGGINAVAMATPATVFVCGEGRLIATINAKPPQIAINTSRTSGLVLAKISGVAS